MDKLHTDINNKGWVARLPHFLQPYALLMRLDRPIGTWLLLLPCFWSITIAHPVWEKGWSGALWLYILFTLGAFFMRGAGCIINDLWDKDFDAQVERTSSRPLASGALSFSAALILLAILLCLSLLVFLALSNKAQILAIFSLPLILLYPLAKRWTRWPQLILGLTFNWGALMGWAAVKDNLEWPAFWLWIGGIFWTLIYDTIYAHQDKQDDTRLGLKSTALTLGEKTKAAMFLFLFCLSFAFIIAGITAHMGIFYYLSIIGIVIFYLYKLSGLDIHNNKQCLSFFRQSHYVGWFLLLGIGLG